MDDNKDENDPKKIDPLSKVFGLEPMIVESNGSIKLPNMDDDYNHVRQNLIDLEEKGRQYLHLFGQVAMSAQEPRHIEVLTNLLESLVNINKSILEIKLLDQDIKKQGEMAGENREIINNNLFVGSTNELQSIIEEIQKKNKNE